ncbi:MAG: RIP metalloprotease [Maricaulaceae bacterium]
MDTAVSLFGAIFSFVVVISLIVYIHELGHYWVGRWCGVTVDEFSLGMGKPLVQWRNKRGERWCVRAFPVGGFVKFAGDADAASVPDRVQLDALRSRMETEKGAAAVRGCFHFKPLWRRAAVVAAGPAANFILAILIYAAFAGIAGETRRAPTVGSVQDDTPAAAAGFEAGDRVVSIDGRAITFFDDIRPAIVLKSGDPVEVVVDREGTLETLTVVPRREAFDDPSGAEVRLGYLGIRSVEDQITYRPGPAEALGRGVELTWRSVATMGDYFVRLATGRESAAMLGGPLRSASTAGGVSSTSFEQGETLWQSLWFTAQSLVLLAAVLSVGVGLVNLLPIPVLDGGHLLYYAYEAVAGRPLGARAQEIGFQFGLALVVGLMVFATLNDLVQLRILERLGALWS